ARGHYVRELDRSVSYQADLAQGFGPYLRDLGQSTRRSLWNLRRRLTDQGAVSLEFVAAGEIDGAFSDLNRLHQLRWKRPAFTGKRLAFHRTLASRLATHTELAFSRLRVGGHVVSMLYDIRKGARQYNIKMGFDPPFSSRESRGCVPIAQQANARLGESRRGIAQDDLAPVFEIQSLRRQSRRYDRLGVRCGFDDFHARAPAVTNRTAHHARARVP